MHIKSYAHAVSVITTLEQNLPTFAGLLGTTVEDQTFLTNSLANMLYVQNYVLVLDDNKKAYTAIKQRLYNGDAGAIPDGPVTEAFDPPFPLLGDVVGFLMLLIQRIQGANKYTREIGIALGIESEPGLSQPAEEVQPTLEVFPAQNGYTMAMVVSGRGDASSWTAQVMPVIGGTGWTNHPGFENKSANLTLTPTTPGVPMQVMVRIQLRRNNADYGLVSDAVTVTLNP